MRWKWISVVIGVVVLISTISWVLSDPLTVDARVWSESAGGVCSFNFELTVSGGVPGYCTAACIRVFRSKQDFKDGKLPRKYDTFSPIPGQPYFLSYADSQEYCVVSVVVMDSENSQADDTDDHIHRCPLVKE